MSRACRANGTKIEKMTDGQTDGQTGVFWSRLSTPPHCLSPRLMLDEILLPRRSEPQDIPFKTLGKSAASGACHQLYFWCFCLSQGVSDTGVFA